MERENNDNNDLWIRDNERFYVCMCIFPFTFASMNMTCLTFPISLVSVVVGVSNLLQKVCATNLKIMKLLSSVSVKYLIYTLEQLWHSDEQPDISRF